MSSCLITWDGPCGKHGKWHACKREGLHPGRHTCTCSAASMVFLNPKPAREPAPRIYQKIPPRTRSWQRREPSFYYPKYLKRKKGLL